MSGASVAVGDPHAGSGDITREYRSGSRTTSVLWLGWLLSWKSGSSTFGLPVSDRCFLPPRLSISRRSTVIQESISSAPLNTIRIFDVFLLPWPRNGKRDRSEDAWDAGARSGSTTDDT